MPDTQTLPEWQHKYEDGRKMRDGTYIRVTAGLHHLQGNRPYFSVTSEVWQSEGWYKNGQDGRMIGGGANHDDIARVFPELAPVIAVHLADDQGVPMHAEANGWYWYSDAYDGTLEKAARSLNIDPSELPEGMTRDQFHTFCDDLRPCWQTMADAAIERLDTLNAQH